MPAMDREQACEIESLGYQGEGICRLEGKVTFVPFALPGEEALISITKDLKTHAFAELKSVAKPSAGRRVPECAVFGACGGCRLQHLEYSRQLAHKRGVVANCLAKIAELEVQVLPVIGMERPWNYRNKTTWQLERRGAQFQAGFFGIKSHRLVPTTACPISHPASSKAVQALLGWLNSRVEATEPLQKDSGACKAITRINAEGKLMLLVSGLGISPSLYASLAKALSGALPELHSLCLVAGGDEESSRDYSQVKVLFGNPGLDEEMDGLRFSLSPASFYQVNHDIARRMYRHALDKALESPGDTCIDIYSGIGTISLLAARRCVQVYGLELSQAAVDDARRSAGLNGLDNARFIQGLAEKTLPEIIKSGLKADTIILDPPRSGAHPRVLQAIIHASPRRVVYISCHPASQARDAAVLAGSGYALKESQPFDMFPQTAEIENVITFERKTT